MLGSLYTYRNTLTMILAGGMGERLYPLTRDRAKPAVPFGGRYRIIDFVLNNFVNSGLFKVKVLTQFKSNSLIEHITRTGSSPEIGQFVDVVPAQMRKGRTGSAGPPTPSTRTSSSSSTKARTTSASSAATTSTSWT
jgi:ADP-glucose pyrophosphorylase